jgi:hypothetical protein
MFDEIYVEHGTTVRQLLDEYGSSLAIASVFEVECQCGEVYRLEPDGQCKCEECGEMVMSPLLKEGFI